MTQSEGWVAIGVVWATSFAAMGFIIRKTRQWNRKARVKRRLLVKTEDGLLVWRVVRGKVLIGWPSGNGEISGEWAKPGMASKEDWGSDWAVIQAAKDKLVVYRFDSRTGDEPKTGVIQICDSWRDLESVVPASIFEKALMEAGVKKPSEYREVPLEL